MAARRENIEDIIKTIQEQMDAANVRRVTELSPEQREQLIEQLRTVLTKPK